MLNIDYKCILIMKLDEGLQNIIHDIQWRRGHNDRWDIWYSYQWYYIIITQILISRCHVFHNTLTHIYTYTYAYHIHVWQIEMLSLAELCIIQVFNKYNLATRKNAIAYKWFVIWLISESHLIRLLVISDSRLRFISFSFPYPASFS